MCKQTIDFINKIFEFPTFNAFQAELQSFKQRENQQKLIDIAQEVLKKPLSEVLNEQSFFDFNTLLSSHFPELTIVIDHYPNEEYEYSQYFYRYGYSNQQIQLNRIWFNFCEKGFTLPNGAVDRQNIFAMLMTSVFILLLIHLAVDKHHNSKVEQFIIKQVIYHYYFSFFVLSDYLKEILYLYNVLCDIEKQFKGCQHNSVVSLSKNDMAINIQKLIEFLIDGNPIVEMGQKTIMRDINTIAKQFVEEMKIDTIVTTASNVNHYDRFNLIADMANEYYKAIDFHNLIFQANYEENHNKSRIIEYINLIWALQHIIVEIYIRMLISAPNDTIYNMSDKTLGCIYYDYAYINEEYVISFIFNELLV